VKLYQANHPLRCSKIQRSPLEESRNHSLCLFKTRQVLALADVEIPSALQHGPMHGKTVHMETEIRKWTEWACIPEMDGMWEGRVKARTPQVQEYKEVTRMTRTGMATLEP
jgi:hypothetical protein